MKLSISLLLIALAIACNSSEIKKDEAAQLPASTGYTKQDLKKIKWIEGKWKGLYKGQPFYEIYRFTNDSTLESISYDWNGTDSSNTSRSYVHYKDGIYYLGDKLKYKVVSITESEIKMLPNVEANNDILWKYRDSTGWDAILKSKNGITTYNMERFDPFKK